MPHDLPVFKATNFGKDAKTLERPKASQLRPRHTGTPLRPLRAAQELSHLAVAVLLKSREFSDIASDLGLLREFRESSHALLPSGCSDSGC